MMAILGCQEAEKKAEEAHMNDKYGLLQTSLAPSVR